jgi:UDP-N-acetylmuramoyl-tripeptide--D-alanyl-D-alanine ligase
MTTQSYIHVAATVLIAFYAAVRLRRELQMLQQNSYRPRRYSRWLWSDRADASRGVDVLMAVVATGFATTRWGAWAVAAVGMIALWKAILLVRTRSKKPLVFTLRASRIYAVGSALMAAGVAAAWLCYGPARAPGAAMMMAVLAPLAVCMAVWILSPVEWLINRRYVNDARRILRSMPRLTVIGITGSYGKTSTKHYLHRILSERFSVVMTPGSYNTTLGVVRTIREHLKPHTEVLIVEMGAKQPGDIAEICDLVHPRIGIVTAVGEQHLESFKTIDNVRRTKFELIDALPPDGVAILNDDFEQIAARPVGNVARVCRYSSADAPGAEYRVVDVRYGRGETTFAICGPDGGNGRGETGCAHERFTTRLAGIHNLSNLLAGYIAGRVLGMTGAAMRHAIASVEQVEHRLQIRHTPGGVTVIDDAFNSNPHGAAMALDVLAGFTDGRRIVVTPGMVELGARQEHHNRELGRLMAASCDLAVVVGEYNREAIVEGLRAGGFPDEKIYPASDFADASRHVGGLVRPGDTILYENDLPDTFK